MTGKELRFPRIKFAEELREYSAQLYKEKLRREMTPEHKKMVFDGITWAVCEYTGPQRKVDDVFRRAACICYHWALGAPNRDLLGLDPLATCLKRFLQREGAEFREGIESNDREFKSDDQESKWYGLKDVIEAVVIDKDLKGKNLFIDLQRTIAKHCVCSWSNPAINFKDKHCHLWD